MFKKNEFQHILAVN